MRKLDIPYNLSAMSCCCGAEHLGARDVEVLVLIARGCSDEEIARKLFVSRQTIAARVSEMLRRVYATNRAELVVRAFVAGLPVPNGWPAEPTGKRCLTVAHAALAG